jgi:cell division septal protein FtsQ
MKIAPRQYRNQRLGRPKQARQQQLLEVSIRRDKERSRRIRRSIGVTFKVLLFAALAAGAWVGTRVALQKLFWQNSFFYLTDVRVTSDGTLTREQILSTSGVVPGSHIFTVDFNKARAALSALPQVDHVEIQRSFPHHVEIDVTERQPVAWITEQSDTDPTATDRAYLVDAHGFVMKTRKVLPEYAHLPMISGAVLENLAPGQKVRDFEILSALELLHVAGDGTRWVIRNIDISKGYCLVVTGRGHSPVVFGLDNLDRQWSRLNRLLDYAESNHKELQTANLLVERNTPVTFYDPEAEAAAAAANATATPPANALSNGKGDPKGAGGFHAPPIASKALTNSTKPDLKASAADSGKGKSKAADVRKPFRPHG